MLTANALAKRMAQTAHVFRDAVAESMASGATSNDLNSLFYSYREHVRSEAGVAEFADTLAQVSVYALFAACCMQNDAWAFSRCELARLPAAHPFLRLLFDLLGGPAIGREPFASALDDLERTLKSCDLGAMCNHAPDELILAFYEAFLRAYDPSIRGRRGVYLTPEPVVGYLVRSVDALLAGELGLEHGLATVNPSARLTIEDPACGTGAFLSAVISHLTRLWASRAEVDGTTRQCLPQLVGCELLAAPCLLAHLIVGLRLRGGSVDAKVDIRLGNALEELEDAAGESQVAAHAGRQGAGATPSAARQFVASAHADEDTILVMLGNPPYRGHSANDGSAIANLLRGRAPGGEPTDNYFAMDGAPLAESNAKWLNDDYVKFIRYAQWRIERAGRGILAYVTSSGYLEGPTFRAMRRSLMRTFDALYLLDLHGNARRHERNADDTHAGTSPRDENVFAIQQGVALALFVRRRGAPGASRTAKLFIAELRGQREEKLRWLAAHSVADTPWGAVQPCAPIYAFTPHTSARHDDIEGIALPALMPEHSLGILTKRDALVIDVEPCDLLRRIADFADLARSDAECATTFALPMRDHDRWDLARTRRELAGAVDPNALRPYAYRPLDTRFLFYDARLVARPNVRVMRHLSRPNMALVVGRQGAATGSSGWDVAFVTDGLTDQNLFRRGGSCVF
ncbi:MAG TPA: type ISP restriction/modification enzyme, partial [Ktedonobacterales bacterium]